VSVDLTPTLLSIAEKRPACTRLGRAERKRLERQDVLASRMAELHCIRAVVVEAIAVVDKGWLQHDWFAVTDGAGTRYRVPASKIHLVTNRPISAACLVAALVHAGGGPPAVHSQLVQRTLDLTWHTLHEDEHRPVRWCPGPAIRTAHVRDLTRWNDHPRRTAEHVTALLHSATRTVDAQACLLRA
jgi:hypothetical protein